MAKRSKRKLTRHTKRRQAAPPSKTKLPSLRGKSGRFVAKTEYEYFQRLTAAEVEDVYDALFRPGWSQVKREKFEAVKLEKIDRYDRAQANPSHYEEIPLERAEADFKLIRKGDLPKPISQRKVGPYNEYIWAYRGMGGKRVVNAILIHDKFPADTYGVTSFGSGYGKDAVWAGTRTSSPLELLNDTSYEALFATGSGKLIRQAMTDDVTAVWWEIKLVTKGVIPHARQFTKVAKTVENRRDTSKTRSGVTPRTANHVRRHKGSTGNKSRKPTKRNTNKASGRKTRNRRK